MNEQRFIVESGLIIDNDNDDCLCDISDYEIIVNTLNSWNKMIGEQQATITKQEKQLKDYQEIKDNWDSMVEMSVKISKRNIELVEENARLRKELEK